MLNKLRGIYVVTDGVLRPDRSHADIAAAAVDGGATVVQLRAKDMATNDLIAVARIVRRITAQAGALLIINDRIDVALEVGADGAHIGQSDMSAREARAVMGANLLLGVSVATIEEASAVLPYASYFGVGPVYGTFTKLDAGAPVGTECLRDLRTAFGNVPIVAIGGINGGNLLDVRDIGVDSAAIVSAIVCAEDMTAATRDLVDLWAG